MKNTVKFKLILVGGLQLCLLFLSSSCKKTEKPCLNQVIIGELRENTPFLTFEDGNKLSRALQLAFIPNAKIDTIFLYNEKDSEGKNIVVLAAEAIENDSLYTSVNFNLVLEERAIIWKPTSKPRWCRGFCINGFEFSSCIGYINDCTCLVGDGPCQHQSNITYQPNDIAEIIIPFLTK